MRARGRVASWNDDRGYGFITPEAGGERVFVHIKAFAQRRRRPVVGDRVRYAATVDRRGRPRAARAAIAGGRQAAGSGSRRRVPAGAMARLSAVGFVLGVGAAALVSAIPPAVLLFYVVISVLTFAVYAWDKAAARRGAWRTSEATLHLLGVAGGWPGALIARHRLRHKSRKQPFRTRFWVTVAVHCGVLLWLLTPAGGRAWRSLAGWVA